MRKFICVLLMSLCLISCSTTTIQRKENKPITFEKSIPYKLDLSQIKKPDPINRMYGIQNNNGTITILPPEKISESNVIILDLNEYKKVGELVNLAVSYKSLLNQQELFINEKILIENSLKELVELESMKTSMYQSLYQESEIMFKDEQRSHKIDDVINKIMQTILIITIGAMSL